MREYNPSNWYWIVAGDETKVFSSKVCDYVPSGNATYKAWTDFDNVPTRIGSEAELGEVLAQAGVRPSAASVLSSFKDSQSANMNIDLVAKVLFNHENRIRAIEGKPSATANQFKQALKDLI